MDLFLTVLPWLLSGITLVVMVLAGNKDVRAWYIGLVGQALWITFSVTSEAWGLMLLSIALVFIYTRNIYKYKRN